MRRQLAIMLSVLAFGTIAPCQKITHTPEYAAADGHFSKIDVSASIACYRRSHFCVEARSWLDPSCRVSLLMNRYEVSRWDNQGISAHLDGNGVVNSSDLLLSFSADTVTEIVHDRTFGSDTYELQDGYSEDNSCKTRRESKGK